MRSRRRIPKVFVAVAVVLLVFIAIQTSLHHCQEKRVPFHSTRVLEAYNDTSEYHSANKEDILEVIAETFAHSFDPPLDESEAYVDINFNRDRVFSFGKRDTALGSIPKIVHFMWKNEIIPSVFVNNLKSFVQHNPNWKYYFWTDRSSEIFLRDQYPTLLESYFKYTLNVSRSDAFRYAVIHYYGGAYFDLDTMCFKSLDVLAETEECIISPEPMEHSVVVTNKMSLMGNCVMLCKPRHDFFSHVLSRLKLTSHIPHFMASAGPAFFGESFNSYINSIVYLGPRLSVNDSIHVMSSEYFLDKIKDDIHSVLSDQCPKYIRGDRDNRLHLDRNLMLDACSKWAKRGNRDRRTSPKAYTVHLYFGTYSGNRHRIDSDKNNHVGNIIPNVQYYPFVKKNDEEFQY